MKTNFQRWDKKTLLPLRGRRWPLIGLPIIRISISRLQCVRWNTGCTGSGIKDRLCCVVEMRCTYRTVTLFLRSRPWEKSPAKFADENAAVIWTDYYERTDYVDMSGSQCEVSLSLSVHPPLVLALYTINADSSRARGGAPSCVINAVIIPAKASGEILTRIISFPFRACNKVKQNSALTFITPAGCNKLVRGRARLAVERRNN